MSADPLSTEREQHYAQKMQTNKQTQWPLVRKRTIPTERPPPVGENYCRKKRM
jgi:hypothetical protein